MVWPTEMVFNVPTVGETCSVLISSKDLGRPRYRQCPDCLLVAYIRTQEDRKVIELVGKYGAKCWSKIAEHLKGRIGKQCRERWHNNLNPELNKGPWTEEEQRYFRSSSMQKLRCHE